GFLFLRKRKPAAAAVAGATAHVPLDPWGVPEQHSSAEGRATNPEAARAVDEAYADPDVYVTTGAHAFMVANGAGGGTVANRVLAPLPTSPSSLPMNRPITPTAINRPSRGPLTKMSAPSFQPRLGVTADPLSPP